VVPDDLLTLHSFQLCNVLFTRELQRRLDENADTKGVIANCFSPGLIVGTGLFRDQNPVFTKVQKQNLDMQRQQWHLILTFKTFKIYSSLTWLQQILLRLAKRLRGAVAVSTT
jgi:hypothetical protein